MFTPGSMPPEIIVISLTVNRWGGGGFDSCHSGDMGPWRLLSTRHEGVRSHRRYRHSHGNGQLPFLSFRLLLFRTFGGWSCMAIAQPVSAVLSMEIQVVISSPGPVMAAFWPGTIAPTQRCLFLQSFDVILRFPCTAAASWGKVCSAPEAQGRKVLWAVRFTSSEYSTWCYENTVSKYLWISQSNSIGYYKEIYDSAPIMCIQRHRNGMMRMLRWFLCVQSVYFLSLKFLKIILKRAFWCFEWLKHEEHTVPRNKT